MAGSSEWNHFAGVLVKRESAKAFLLVFHPNDRKNQREHWVPKSVVADAEDVQVQRIQDISIKEWFCQKEELGDGSD